MVCKFSTTSPEVLAAHIISAHWDKNWRFKKEDLHLIAITGDSQPQGPLTQHLQLQCSPPQPQAWPAPTYSPVQNPSSGRLQLPPGGLQRPLTLGPPTSPSSRQSQLSGVIQTPGLAGPEVPRLEGLAMASLLSAPEYAKATSTPAKMDDFRPYTGIEKHHLYLLVLPLFLLLVKTLPLLDHLTSLSLAQSPVTDTLLSLRSAEVTRREVGKEVHLPPGQLDIILSHPYSLQALLIYQEAQLPTFHFGLSKFLQVRPSSSQFNFLDRTELGPGEVVEPLVTLLMATKLLLSLAIMELLLSLVSTRLDAEQLKAAVQSRRLLVTPLHQDLGPDSTLLGNQVTMDNQEVGLSSQATLVHPSPEENLWSRYKTDNIF